MKKKGMLETNKVIEIPAYSGRDLIDDYC